MTRKIFWSIFFAAIAVFIACMIIIVGVIYEYFSLLQEDQLENQTSFAAQGLEKYGSGFINDIDSEGFHITLVDMDGSVLYDSAGEAAVGEDYGSRKEIKAAFETGSGKTSRSSPALAERMLYHAKLLSDGTVVCLSVMQHTVVTLLMGMLPSLVFVLLVSLLLSALLASRLSKHIVEPLNSLDLERPLENDAYDELSPLLSRIEQQHRETERHESELMRKQDEFAAVTSSMSEGLILLNETGIILSINPAAAELFDVGTDSIDKDLLTVSRNLSLQKLVEKAQAGKHGEMEMELNGGNYQINTSPVISLGKVAGVAILAFDITEKAQLEQQRREFTANVSHELKTPLQSILGSAELIETGLVKQEDVPAFIGRIRSSASRLVTLIDDIIRLSQMDEKGEIPTEDVDLKAVALDVLELLSGQAELKNVTLELRGVNSTINGSRRLLFDIVYNLCDNAIKYNVDGGHVDITIEESRDHTKLTVRDSGIGIPKEQQSHIFERFYRVDNSHSTLTGGTGLGLSIVKHAALYHRAAVELKSELNKGTEISLTFPR